MYLFSLHNAIPAFPSLSHNQRMYKFEYSISNEEENNLNTIMIDLLIMIYIQTDVNALFQQKEI